jgi:tRNA (guanine37-N1)-methyltransferase
LRIDVITLFPEIFFGPFDESIIGRARKQGLVEINAVDLRKYTHDARGTVDDKPYGGGPGMLMKAEPLFEAIDDLRTEESLVILTGPRGEQFKQATARELSHKQHLIFISGHYEGVDERVCEALIDREMSIGDYVLTSGNLAAMVMIDAAVRLLPGVLGSPESEIDESFSNGLLEYPQYTRPPDFKGMKVPEILLSGDHGAIEKWRHEESLKATRKQRPDLYDAYNREHDIKTKF